jgi:uncharacterized membrane protein YdjX (TVP38/TMEM64 family)
MAEPDEPETWEPRNQRTKDAAVLLPFVVLLLLVPPVILAFAAPAMVAGIPLIVVYVYGVWTIAVLVAFLVARRLDRAGAEQPVATDRMAGDA